MDDGELRRRALIHALDNAQRHGGSAQAGAVIGSLLGSSPELRARAREVKAIVQSVVAEANAMAPEAQAARLAELSPTPIAREREERRTGLPPLPGAEDGKVVTRFPPEPNGFPHIGHAYSAIINHLYARMYHGSLVLRFEDTNPRKEEVRYYEAIKDGLSWLGVGWDREIKVSDDIPLILEHAARLLADGALYVCDCPAATVSANRRAARECSCRQRPLEEGLELWERMNAREFGEGEVGVRLRGDMAAENMVLRDPMMLRVIDHPHPLHGDRYYVYPTYDFAVAIEDSRCGITHVLRSNEFAPRIELQERIRGLLGLPNPRIIQYSRLSLEGTPTSKRIIRALIDAGVVEGWDDPRLSTLAALRRRGVLPQTIEDLAVEIGPTTAAPVVSWQLIAGLNRKNLDPVAPRAFVVVDPVELSVAGAPSRTVRLARHPGDPSLGERALDAGPCFHLAAADAARLSAGDVVRLKDLYNVRVERVEQGRVEASYAGDELVKGVPKLHWVGEGAVEVSVAFCGALMRRSEEEQAQAAPSEEDGEEEEAPAPAAAADPGSLRLARALGEPTLRSAKAGDLIQMERVGFARVDRVEGGVVRVVYAHD